MIYKGKRTIILSHLLRTIKGKDKLKLNQILSEEGGQKTKTEVKWVTNKMKESRSIKYGQKLALKMKVKALEIFNKDLTFLSDQPARRKPGTLIEFNP